MKFMKEVKMIHDIIIDRKSIRAFNSEDIDDEKLLSLFEAARLAPSSMNEQPWRFIFAEKNDDLSFEKILNTLADTNKIWAKNASLLIIVLSKKNLDRNYKPNKYYFYDAASAVSNLTFQANSLDLYVHQMGGFDSEKIQEIFQVPEQFEPVVIFAVGGKSDVNNLPEPYKERENLPQKRLALNELLFGDNFGEPHPLLEENLQQEVIAK
jgi:nitroreductase